MHTATRAYASVAKQTSSPRELEATLLLKAAAKLQAVHDAWEDRRDLDEALLYNRRLWVVFIDSVLQDDHPLPAPVRQNLVNLGVFVMIETFSLMTDPQLGHLRSLIKINRELATGLQGHG
jgi:flagellar protein FlaF